VRNSLDVSKLVHVTSEAKVIAVNKVAISQLSKANFEDDLRRNLNHILE
jgi:hypothetical protein